MYLRLITLLQKHNLSHFYVWTEDQTGRGSVEVASGLCDLLEKFEFPLENNSLRLFADGCGGQNKDAHVV